MLTIRLARILGAFTIVTVCSSFMPQQMAAEQKPRVALINEKIQTQDSAVVVEKVVVYPDEGSVYGPGEENYGRAVKDEYSKGPIVVLRIERYPGHPWDWDALFADEWIRVELFSDGRKLQQSCSGEEGSGRLVFGFSFWAEADTSVSRERAVELKELGELEIKIALSRIVKVFDIPLHDLPRGEDPIFEDEDVQIWEVRWEERRSKFRQKNFLSLRVRFKSKTEFASYNLAFLGEKGPVGAVGDISSWKEYYRSVPEITGAQFWKCVKLTERTISPLRFVPQ